MLDIELKTALDALQGETKTIFTDLKTRYDALHVDHGKLQKQVDAIDLANRAHPGGVGQKTVLDFLNEHDGFNRLVRDRKGTAYLTLSGDDCSLLQRKTTITSAAAGAMTTGVLQIDRTPGITPEARQRLTVRGVLSARPTSLGLVDFIRVNAAPSASTFMSQTEASDKFENASTFTSVSEKVRTLATWIPATKQILEDMTELAGYISTALPYYVNLEEEVQLLSGAGTGEYLHGFVTQGTAFDTSMLSASKGWNKIDIIGRVVQQITTAKEIQPSFVIMHPNDWWEMRLTKDSYGRYILGDPQTNVRPSLFGLDVVPTVSIADGTFLVGSGDPVCSEIRDRMEMQVEVSTEHQDYFVKNLVAIRAEKRLCLVVKRPASYIHGSFTNSPA